MNSSVSTRRWILPVGPRGISSMTWIPRGTLKSASLVLQKAMSSLVVASSFGEGPTADLSNPFL